MNRRLKKPVPKTKFGLKSGKEMKVYGVHACLAVYESRKQDIIRVYVGEELETDVSELLKYCAGQKKAFHKVSNVDLENIVESTHHEGLAMVIKKREEVSEGSFLRQITTSDPYPIFYFDGVSNPHNLGAIFRTLTHYGIKWVLGQEKGLPELSPSAMRISEGGCEFVNMVRIKDPVALFKKLKEHGWQIIGTSSHESDSLAKWKPVEKTVVVLGAEVTGMSNEIQKICDRNLCIAGTGKIESLNVSVAAGIIANHITQTYFK